MGRMIVVLLKKSLYIPNQKAKTVGDKNIIETIKKLNQRVINLDDKQSIKIKKIIKLL